MYTHYLRRIRVNTVYNSTKPYLPPMRTIMRFSLQAKLILNYFTMARLNKLHHPISPFLYTNISRPV